MGYQVFDGGHDFRDACLIVRAQQRVSVRDDQFLSDIIFQDGKFGCGNDFSVFQRDVPALIRDAFRGDIFPRTYGFGIQVCNESESGQIFRIGGDMPVHIAVFVHEGVRNAERFQFVRKNPGEVKLLFRAGMRARFRIGLRIDFYIAEKSFLYSHNRNRLLKTDSVFFFFISIPLFSAFDKFFRRDKRGNVRDDRETFVRAAKAPASARLFIDDMQRLYLAAHKFSVPGTE